jgi:hypothetical protein
MLLVLLKHILLKKEHDLLVFQLFVSTHFYEYFFLILMYVFVNLKFSKTFCERAFLVSFFSKNLFFLSASKPRMIFSNLKAFFTPEVQEQNRFLRIFLKRLNKKDERFWVTNSKLCTYFSIECNFCIFEEKNKFTVIEAVGTKSCIETCNP